MAGRSLVSGSEDLFDRLSAHVDTVHGVVLDRAELRSAAHLLVAASHEERTAEIGGVLLSSHELSPLVVEYLRPLDSGVARGARGGSAGFSRDVRSAGLLLTGGGARLEGIERHVAHLAGASARVAGEPEECTVRGTGLAVDNLDVLRRNFMYIR